MTHAIFFAALAASLMGTATAFAHDGHGLGGAHWHATDVLGFVAVAALAALVWFKRK
jgi:hypothetical protein